MGTPPPVPTPSLARVIVPRPAPAGFVSMATHGHGPALDAADGRPAMRVTPTLAPLSRRLCLAASLTGSLVWGMGFARAAILEADDDDELLERVKKDRKKRLERQGIIRSSDKETGYLQELVYKMSKVGQAIENNDLSLASFVLGLDADANWVEDVNAAFTKLSSSPEEKVEVDTFNSSLTSLFSSVRKRNIESSKLAFVSSAAALEKWIGLTGLVGQLKGYLQELVYKMSKVGQAIENNDLSLASFVLGLDADANWVEDVNAAFTKLSSSPEEKVEVDTFNSSLTSLFSSVRKRNIESSKLAFVSSAAALEKWIGLTGLVGQLKGL